jgi:S-DNA-T family DNA segregation ATPase FtsK/SpoIIIE
VLVDDVERLAASAAEDLLVGAADDVALVAAGTTADLLASYRGLGAQLRRSRTGVLLHPLGAGDGELLGMRRARTAAGPPGRATLVDDGRARVLQAALPAAAGLPHGHLSSGAGSVDEPQGVPGSGP